jgi:hypothetical protein
MKVSMVDFDWIGVANMGMLVLLSSHFMRFILGESYDAQWELGAMSQIEEKKENPFPSFSQ